MSIPSRGILNFDFLARITNVSSNARPQSTSAHLPRDNHIRILRNKRRQALPQIRIPPRTRRVPEPARLRAAVKEHVAPVARVDCRRGVDDAHGLAAEFLFFERHELGDEPDVGRDALPPLGHECVGP